MKIKIEIECSDPDEVLTHLSVIRAAAKKKMAKMAKTNPEGKWPDIVFTDNNCYGYHKVKIVDNMGKFDESKLPKL